jgi:hypothetical protein
MSEDFNLRAKSASAANPGDVQVRAAPDGMLPTMSRYAELAQRGNVYSASRVTMTLPVNAATLVSLMGLYNPPGSGKMVEMIDIEAHYVVATTVVNALGLYYSNGSDATGATFTTQLQSAVENARVGEGVPSVCRFYSAVTHVGTPKLLDIVGGWGAVTDGGATPIRKEWNGVIQVPPGTLLAVAMTTAAATGSGVTAMIRWAEVPYVSA